MDQEKQEPAENHVSFFIQELARMEQTEEQRYKSLSGRISRLEQKGKATDDPEKLLGSLFLMVAVIQAIPLVIDLVRKLWSAPGDSVSS